MKSTWRSNALITHVLLVHAASYVKVRFVTKEHKQVDRKVVNQRFSSNLMGTPILFTYLLHYSYCRDGN